MATQPYPQPQVFIARFTSHEPEAATIILESNQFKGTLELPGPETFVQQTFNIKPGLQVSLTITVLAAIGKGRASAILKDVEGIEIVQSAEGYVSAFVRHQPSFEGQCTVRCPQTGESRTGRGACIECSDGELTIRICC